MSAREAPRLTGMLRAFQVGQKYDYQTEYLNRIEILKKRKKLTKSSKELRSDGFNWEFFSSLLDEYETAELKKIRIIFNKYMNLIRNIINDDQTTTEELHSSALFFYNTVLDAHLKIDEKRTTLRQNLPLINNKQLEEGFAVVKELDDWRRAHLDRHSRRAGYDVHAHGYADTVFGKDVALKLDPNFLFDEADLSDDDDELNAEPHSETNDAIKVDWVTGGEVIDIDWLKNMCENYTAAVLSAGGAALMTPVDLAKTLHAHLQSKKSDLELQDSLFDLLGPTSIDFIQLLLKNRIKLMKLNFGAVVSHSAPQQSRPQFGPGVTIQTKQEQIYQKLLEKERKKQQRNTQNSDDGDMYDDAQALRMKREQQLANARTAMPTDIYIRDEYATTGLGDKIVLPEGTIRKKTNDIEEVKIPPAKTPPFTETEKLVPITEFSEFAQIAFRGIKTLNRIQSRVFEAAYKSNENLLICAPTGAGKTNVAMMTMLHEIGQHFRGGYLHKDEFKLIYVAPMKALAAEMTESFGKRLEPLGVVVRELTGDMQLSKKEIVETQVIVTTPEKWDVITRKSTDVALTQLVKLLIIDEVHLLHEDRGSVIESIVARTLRQVEQTQNMIRIVGLSATLPNYADVAQFLRVNLRTGLFYFDQRYRPVPLSQEYIGVRGNALQGKQRMNQVCFDRVKQSVIAGNQVMVFVHSRKDTYNTAKALLELARASGTSDVFRPNDKDPNYVAAVKEVSRSRNKELKELFPLGFSMHHAGMLRPDRSLVERLFRDGLIQVLVCTATLAWGVNLPAHTVVIKGTQLYDPSKGSFVDLGMLDVMQIFGRAGRPQYDTSGEGIIITSHDKLTHYLRLMTHQLPIESQFIKRLADHLNAEIVLGTVTNIQEAVTWLSYTYLFIRMAKNPWYYGIAYNQKQMDPRLVSVRRDFIIVAAKLLDKCQMIRYDAVTGSFYPTDLGRVASHYYIQYETISMFNEQVKSTISDADIFNAVAHASEFENITQRDEEMEELGRLEEDSCYLEVKGGVENQYGKVNILLQSYISQARVDSFSLVSDMSYIAQNASRIFRALFEIVLKKNWISLATRLLSICKMVDKRLWSFYHPLRQFPHLGAALLTKLEERKASLDQVENMSLDEIANLTRTNKLVARTVKQAVDQFPRLAIDVQVQPITRTVLKIQLTVLADFEWNDRAHGAVEPWWIWVEDAQNEHIYHSEYFLLHKKQKDEAQKLTFIIPIFEDTSLSQYFIHAISDRWLAAETVVPMPLSDIVMPSNYTPNTELLDLQPMPVSSLDNKGFESLYPFTHFNPVQTQAFHAMYHSEVNALVGAPTGSGKTIIAELAMLKLFRDSPKLKVIYIGPLKALVRERMKDWKKKFVDKLGKRLIELTGDYTPDVLSLQKADIVTTTPEKWDGISRNWKNRKYVKEVGLMIIDEVHLLGEERGPILEVIVSRMRYISSQTDTPIRIIGLSTALANAEDLSDWLGTDPNMGLYNFRPSVRPVPLEAHIQGYQGRHYCPRMATMNKPAFAAIKTHSLVKPVLIFVSSRRQTRLTAMDLINYCASDDNPRQFMKMGELELESVLDQVRDPHLKHTITFGIGMHHAGLTDSDRALCEELFAREKIQILISTATLAWGVNLPAHLVVIKGTEFFDPKTKRYVDYPITDVLQMMGRAGRPQYDTSAVAVIMVEESKKSFYKKFLYEPFPVESSLKDYLHDHINAEITSGTITSKQDAVDYLTWTYFFRRLLKNPSFYQLEDTTVESLNQYLSDLIDRTLRDLELAQCIKVEDDAIETLTLGRIASYYYLHYTTVQLFHNDMHEQSTIQELLTTLCNTREYEDLPVRHNEDKLNAELAEHVPWSVDTRFVESPHVKTHLLLQTHFANGAIELPISDYETDLKSVLDQAVRILQAMVDVTADRGWLFTTLRIVHLMQMILQGLWYPNLSMDPRYGDSSTLYQLPHITPEIVDVLYAANIESIAELAAMSAVNVRQVLRGQLNRREVDEVIDVLHQMPVIQVKTVLGQVTAGQECEIRLTFHRLTKEPKEGIYAPKFPKRKEESWWLILGDPNTGELLALRRMGIGARMTTSLTFNAPTLAGDYTYYVYLMSDSYMGLDQQYKISFTIDKSVQNDEETVIGDEEEFEDI